MRDAAFGDLQPFYRDILEDLWKFSPPTFLLH